MAVVYTKEQKKSIIIRISLLAILLAVIVVCIVIIVNQFKPKKGLNIIPHDMSKHSGEMTNYNFSYYLDDGDGNKKNALEKLYSESFDKIYELIDEYENIENLNNIYYINNHINEDITIDPILYNYLKKVYDLNPKYILSGSLYDYWWQMTNTIYPEQRDEIDPINDLEIKSSIDYFVNTSINHISLDFKDNNVIRLNVDNEYKIVSDNDKYISFSLFYKPVILDYIKNQLNDKGYSNGYIVTLDGFYQDLGLVATNINIKLTSREYLNGYYNLECKKGNNYVLLYDYKINSYYSYYEYNNEKRTLFLDYNTGYSFDYNSSIYYSTNSLIDTLSGVYDYYYNKKGINYIIQKEHKIYTNVKEITSENIEVVYE